MNNAKVVLREATSREVEQWDKLVTRFQNHRVMHTLGWIRSLEDSTGGRPLFLVYEKGGEIVACLPGLITKVGPIRVFGSPLPGWQTNSMGPAFLESAVTTDEMITRLPRYLEGEHGVHHIEMVSHILDGTSMTHAGFRPERRTVYRVPMHPGDQDTTWMNLKRNARNKIRKAEKQGLVARFVDDSSFVDEIYDQLTEVFARGGNTMPYPKRRVAALFGRMKKSGNLIALGVFPPDSDVCVATGLFIVGNKELILWSWTYRTKYRDLNPTEFMTWTAMLRGMEMGCTVMPLGGGREEFKTKFGADTVETKHRWVRSRYKWMMGARDLAERCYRWQQSVRGELVRRRSIVREKVES